MRKVKEQMRPIRVLYSDTQHTHQMQILVKCKWDAILGDNIILLSRYALLFCMETFLFENRTEAATEPHKNHTMYVCTFSLFCWHIPFSVCSKSLCNPAVDHTKRLDTHTKWHFKQTNLLQSSFGLGQSVGQTTNTSVYTNKSREFVALALVPDGLQHLIRFFTHVWSFNNNLQ